MMLVTRQLSWSIVSCSLSMSSRAGQKPSGVGRSGDAAPPRQMLRPVTLCCQGPVAEMAFTVADSRFSSAASWRGARCACRTCDHGPGVGHYRGATAGDHNRCSLRLQRWSLAVRCASRSCIRHLAVQDGGQRRGLRVQHSRQKANMVRTPGGSSARPRPRSASRLRILVSRMVRSAARSRASLPRCSVSANSAALLACDAELVAVSRCCSRNMAADRCLSHGSCVHIAMLG